MAEIKDVFTVVENGKEPGKGFWNRIGSGFTNKDGSLNIKLNALPVNGQLVVRDPRPTAAASS